MEQIEKKTLILPTSMSFLKDTYILQLSNFILLIFIDNFNVKFDFLSCQISKMRKNYKKDSLSQVSLSPFFTAGYKNSSSIN